MSNRKSAKAPRADEWGVVVRLADGSTLFYCEDSQRQAQHEWTPRERDAQRFPTEATAAAFAATCQTNGAAREYRAVKLPQPR